MRSRGLSLLLITGTLLFAARARAAGPYLGDVNVIGMGQAGAYVASPSTLAAFWYNPAALAGQAGLKLELEGGLHLTPETYQRARDPDSGRSFPAAVNQDILKPAVFGAITYDFGIPGLAIGAAVYSPTAGQYKFSETGPQRYQAISADSTALHIHLGVAYKIFKWLSLGLTFGNTYFQTVQRVAVSGAIGDDPEDAAFSVPFTISVTDPFTITSNFGVRVEPIEQLSIGLSIMPPYDVNATGTAVVKLPPALDQVTIDGNKVALNVSFPMILRAGIRYRPIPKVGIEAAFVWEQWSRNKVIDLLPDNITVSFPPVIDNQQLPAFQLDKRNKDAFSARLGVEATPLDALTVRGGVFYESPAIRPERFDLTQPDNHKVGIAVGASVHFWKMWIDAAYVHAFIPPVTVNNSETQTIGVLPTSTPATVGNGTYTFSYDMIHIGLRAAFFDGPKPAPVSEPVSEPVSAPASTAASEPTADH